MTESLSTALAWLRDELAHVRLTVPLPGAPQTKQWIASAIGQLDDYLLPRLRSIEAPILAVVGGSTGAGKSTLVNSLLGAVVTIPGVIRPTTKAPVLIHNPADAHWFNTDRILPGLTRSALSNGNVRALQIMSSTVVPVGLAILDTPDIDSVDESNRNLASQLLAAADLWLFVTSAARYADAVPWEYLSQAAGRSAAVAVVIDRVPPNAMAAVPEDLARMMTERGLGDSPLFAVPETVVNELGLLPSSAVQPIQAWLTYLASNQITRAQVVMRTLDGAMKTLESGVATVAQHITQQNQAVRRLKTDAETIFTDAKRSFRAQSSDGTLLRGEVLSRWQDFVGAGTFMTSVQTWIGRMRDRVTRVFSGETAQVADVQIAVKSGLETLLIEAGQSAVERVAAAWGADPTGRFLIDWSEADLTTVSPDYPAQVEQAIRLWQDDVLNLVSQEGAGRKTKARLAALGVNAVGVSLMLVAFAHTAGFTGAEIGIAGGTAVVAQKVLELVFGDDAIRRLAHEAQERLGARMDQVLDAQRLRLLSLSVDRFPVETVEPEALVACGERLAVARQEEMRRLQEQTITITAASARPDVQPIVKAEVGDA